MRRYIDCAIRCPELRAVEYTAAANAKSYLRADNATSRSYMIDDLRAVSRFLRAAELRN